MSNNNGDKLNENKTGEINKDRLQVIEARIKELEPDRDNPIAKKELGELYSEKTKLILNSKTLEPKNYKIAEILIIDGQVAMDAIPKFWGNKLMALGILEVCKDIVKEYNPEPKKINLVDKLGMKRFVNGLKRRF